MGSCLFGAESSLRLLACRGRTASLLRQAGICGASLARINKARSRRRQSTSALILAKTRVYWFEDGIKSYTSFSCKKD
ncbi:hypothetical protein NBRC111894_4195 [Sporolactobacillus inulinus]|uniref:Uncharacterized protein n=1 Tax=Sporolactobacillus inulinus TaxID=2078 RepID=A0A4Y1ZI52_9BACL|nr:hypothetical protein NBRC111894_4195 [Sporolactobacillus inulinus]